VYLDLAKRILRRSPALAGLAGRVARLFSRPFDGSESYWVKRYASGGSSGAGSYGAPAEFKARVLNDFVREHAV